MVVVAVVALLNGGGGGGEWVEEGAKVSFERTQKQGFSWHSVRRTNSIPHSTEQRIFQLFFADFQPNI